MGCNPILKRLHCGQWDCAASVIAALTQTDSDAWCKTGPKTCIEQYSYSGDGKNLKSSISRFVWVKLCFYDTVSTALLKPKLISCGKQHSLSWWPHSNKYNSMWFPWFFFFIFPLGKNSLRKIIFSIIFGKFPVLLSGKINIQIPCAMATLSLHQKPLISDGVYLPWKVTSDPSPSEGLFLWVYFSSNLPQRSFSIRGLFWRSLFLSNLLQRSLSIRGLFWLGLFPVELTTAFPFHQRFVLTGFISCTTYHSIPSPLGVCTDVVYFLELNLPPGGEPLNYILTTPIVLPLQRITQNTKPDHKRLSERTVQKSPAVLILVDDKVDTESHCPDQQWSLTRFTHNLQIISPMLS